MKSFRLAAVALTALLLLVVVVAPAAAQTGEEGKVVFGGRYTLRSGEVLVGDLALFGGSAVIEEGGLVRGDIFSMGGVLDLAGAVQGDVVIFGGSADVAASATVAGDLVRFGGSLDVAPGAQIGGEVRQGGTFNLPGLWSDGLRPPVFTPSGPSDGQLQQSPAGWLLAAFLALVRAAATVAAMGALALVIALLWPRGVERMGQAGQRAPFMALATGALTWLVALALIAFTALTFCLIPVAVLLSLALAAAAVMSWIVAGWWAGRRLLALLNVARPNTVLEATIGTALVVGVYFLVGIVPCVNFIYGALVSSFGLGAVALTRFGTRAFPPPPLAAAPIQSPPALSSGDQTAVSVAEERNVQP